MFQLAVNGIPELYELLYNYDLPLDYIKCPLSPNSRAEVAKARQYLPVLLHGWGPPGYSVVMQKIPEPKLLQELVKTSQTPFISAHLDYNPERDGDLSKEALIHRVQRNVEALKDLTGLEVLIENLPFYAWRSRPRYTTDPAFIADTLEASGAHFLLDVSHATVAAWHRNQDPWDYISQMPLEQVWEVHTSGSRDSEKGLRDFHGSLREQDYGLLEQTLRHTSSLRVLTLEYMPIEQLKDEPQGPGVLMLQIMRLEELRRRSAPVTTPEFAPDLPQLRLHRP